MPEVTLNVVKNTNSNEKTNSFTLKVENKALINSILTVGNNNSITESQMKQLQAVAAKNGDYGVLEVCDLAPKEVINYANTLGFSEYYDIKLSDDGKYFQVKIKDVDAFTLDPNLATIKKDFGIKNGVFVKKGEIPHGNEGVIPGWTEDGNFDNIVIQSGKTINIPVSEVNISGSPRGFWGRLFQ